MPSGLVVDRAGTLRHRIQLQRPVQVTNEYGEPVNGWVTVATVWASVVPLEGRELWQAKQVAPDVSHNVALRDGPHINGIDPSWRVIHDSRVLEIEKAPLRNERKRTMRDLLCKELAGVSWRDTGSDAAYFASPFWAEPMFAGPMFA